MDFNAEIKIIGINPYISLPESILSKIMLDSNKTKSPIPVFGNLNGKPYRQNLMKFKGEWRLCVNTTMLKDSPKKVGQNVKISVQFDPILKVAAVHPELLAALKLNPTANENFNNLRPSLQAEMHRYILNLKSAESVGKNIIKALDYLTGKGSFLGRKLI